MMGSSENSRDAAVTRMKIGIRQLLESFAASYHAESNVLKKVEILDAHTKGILDIMELSTTTFCVATMDILRKDLLKTIDDGMRKNMELMVGAACGK